jgi:hypothetical protein
MRGSVSPEIVMDVLPLLGFEPLTVQPVAQSLYRLSYSGTLKSNAYVHHQVNFLDRENKVDLVHAVKV